MKYLATNILNCTIDMSDQIAQSFLIAIANHSCSKEMKVSAFETTLTAIALAFGNGASVDLSQPDDRVLINRPEQEKMTHRRSFGFEPIDMTKIKKIEDAVTLASSTTKCCASGTCDSLDFNSLYEYNFDYMMWWCRQPDGPPCP